MTTGVDALSRTQSAAPWRLPRLADPSMVVWLILIFVLVFLVASPMVRLVLASFQEPETGAFTFGNYVEAYGSLRHLRAALNSLELGLGVALLAGLFGVPIAWAISRTDMPLKGFVRLMVFAAFIIPPYLGAIGWILLAGPNSGWLNRVWMGLTGAEHGIFNVYSMPGLILVVAVTSFPYVFVFVNAALDLVSSEMEDAAHILGAGTLRTTFRVTLPLVYPAIIGGLIISFLEAIALFGAPALIALPARFHVVSTQLWQFFEYPVRVETAAAYALPLLIVTVLLFWLQRTILGRKGYASVTGKGGERRMLRLGAWRWVMLGYALGVGALAVLLPMLVLLQAAFAKAWGRGFSLDNLTLRNFHYILFEQTQAQQAIVNTFVYSGATAFAAIGLTLAIAYVVSRKLVPWSGLLALMCMAPFVIPGIVLAIGFYAAYAPPPLALYGTAAILILGFTTRFLPIAYTSSAAGMRSINPEMEEAVRVLGGGRFTAIRRVLAPLLKKSLAGAWILVFIPATRELSAAIFLVGPNTRVISVMLFDLSEEGNFEVLSALGAILLVITVAIAAIGFKVIGRDFMLTAGLSMSKLALRGLSKHFGSVAAVDGVDLALDEGEFVSLLGPSGCGKTTTLRMIAGFIDPTAGEIEMDGRVMSAPSGSVPPERRGMSMIFQSYAVWPNMTVAQNVAFGLELRKLAKAEVRRRVHEMLEVVHMGHLADRYPAELSGGQQQRVALARAIVIKPQVLLLDEPLSNLDANLREEMRFEIRRLHDEFRITTVYVTHDQAEAMVTSDRIAVMNAGRIEQVDDPHTLYTRPKTRFVAGFIGRTNFIDGARSGAEIVFDGFAIPRAAFENGGALDGKLTFSVRPQCLRLLRAQPAGAGRPAVAVTVAERAYLGEFWDYVVAPKEGTLRLKVTAPPLEVYQVGEAAWLELDPRQMALISEEA